VYYTVQEVAEKLKVAPPTVITLIKSGRLAGFKLGSLWRIKAEALEALESSGGSYDRRSE